MWLRDWMAENGQGMEFCSVNPAAVLGPFVPKLQNYTKERLEKMGIEVVLNTAAATMDAESITVNFRSRGEILDAIDLAVGRHEMAPCLGLCAPVEHGCDAADEHDERELDAKGASPAFTDA